MLIYGLGRAIQADREREIQKRLRHRGLLRDELETVVTRSPQVVATGPKRVGAIGIRSARVRSFGTSVRGPSR